MLLAHGSQKGSMLSFFLFSSGVSSTACDVLSLVLIGGCFSHFIESIRIIKQVLAQQAAYASPLENSSFSIQTSLLCII